MVLTLHLDPLPNGWWPGLLCIVVFPFSERMPSNKDSHYQRFWEWWRALLPTSWLFCNHAEIREEVGRFFPRSKKSKKIRYSLFGKSKISEVVIPLAATLPPPPRPHRPPCFSSPPPSPRRWRPRRMSGCCTTARGSRSYPPLSSPAVCLEGTQCLLDWQTLYVIFD